MALASLLNHFVSMVPEKMEGLNWLCFPPGTLAVDGCLWEALVMVTAVVTPLWASLDTGMHVMVHMKLIL